MRIESLTLHNLNALRGRWHIDFNALAGNGIFAITGPTGAGKSTILDALCLALYGQTPRLGKITQNNNELMTRHTGECSAEMVIVVDGRRYRIFWGQKRARGKADGKLQAPRHEIADADSGILIEDKTKNTQHVIEALTGLDFERFVRAVLLAQGQFAAFLHADGDERAPILEQITGTDIYSRLSMAVHARYSEAQQTLQQLQSEHAHLAPPDAQALAELAAALDDAAKQVAASKAARDAGAAMLALLRDIAQENAQYAALQAEAAMCENAWAALADVRTALSLYEKSLAGTDSYNEWQRGVRETADLEAQQADKQRQAHTLQQQSDAAAHSVQEAHRALAAAQAAETAAQPLLQQARALDGEAQRLQGLLQEKTQQVQNLAFADASTLHALAAQTIDEAAIERDYREALAGKTPACWRAEQERLRERFSALRDCLREYQSLREALQQREAKQHTLQAVSARCQAAQAAENATHAALLSAKASSDDKRRILEEARLIRSFARHRADLRPGQACPLCGAHEHPYAEGAALPDADDAALQQALAAEKIAGEQHQAAHTARVQLERDMEHARHDLHQHTQSVAAREETLAAQEKALAVSRTEAPQALADCEAAGKAVSARLQRLENLQAQREAAENIRKARVWVNACAALVARQQSLADNREARKKLIEEDNLDAYHESLRACISEKSRAHDAAKEQVQRLRADLHAAQAAQQTLATLAEQSRTKAHAAEQAWQRALTDSGFAGREDWHRAQQHGEHAAQWQAQVQESAQQRRLLADRLTKQQMRLGELVTRLPDPVPDMETIETEQQSHETAYASALHAQGQLLAREREYRERSAQWAVRSERLAVQGRECELWRHMHDLIGSADGKKFRLFAQGLTFDIMIRYANRELAKMSDRYVLVRAQSGHLALDVMDDWQGGAVRTSKNLSGGEQFIVSLALALGLSSMAGEKIRIDSLFLDEGFGTLDEQALDQALDTLASLPAQGKLIGIISHVGALRERIPTQIRVIPQSGGISRLQGDGIHEE